MQTASSHSCNFSVEMFATWGQIVFVLSLWKLANGHNVTKLHF